VHHVLSVTNIYHIEFFHILSWFSFLSSFCCFIYFCYWGWSQRNMSWTWNSKCGTSKKLCMNLFWCLELACTKALSPGWASQGSVPDGPAIPAEQHDWPHSLSRDAERTMCHAANFAIFITKTVSPGTSSGSFREY